jgi:hypothetical protein
MLSGFAINDETYLPQGVDGSFFVCPPAEKIPEINFLEDVK